jgi:hypothetical protein
MPTKHLLPMTSCVTFKDFAMTRVLNALLSKLEKLEESRTLVANTIGRQQRNHVLWAQNHYQTKSFSLGTMYFGFQKHGRNTWANSNTTRLDQTRLSIVHQTIHHF